jgi:hypothetical protein
MIVGDICGTHYERIIFIAGSLLFPVAENANLVLKMEFLFDEGFRGLRKEGVYLFNLNFEWQNLLLISLLEFCPLMKPITL